MQSCKETRKSNVNKAPYSSPSFTGSTVGTSIVSHSSASFSVLGFSWNILKQIPGNIYTSFFTVSYLLCTKATHRLIQPIPSRGSIFRYFHLNDVTSNIFIAISLCTSLFTSLEINSSLKLFPLLNCPEERLYHFPFS